MDLQQSPFTLDLSKPQGLSIALARDFGSVNRWRAEFTALAKAMGTPS